MNASGASITTSYDSDRPPVAFITTSYRRRPVGIITDAHIATLKGLAPVPSGAMCDHPDARELDSGIDSSGIGKLTEWVKLECQDCGAIFHETYPVDHR